MQEVVGLFFLFCGFDISRGDEFDEFFYSSIRNSLQANLALGVLGKCAFDELNRRALKSVRCLYKNFGQGAFERFKHQISNDVRFALDVEIKAYDV